MPKPFHLPPPIAESFARDMKAYFAEENAIKRDEIVSRQLTALRQFQRPREKRLSLADVIEMFVQMRDWSLLRYSGACGRVCRYKRCPTETVRHHTI
jgi:hypothetical protein